MKNLLLVAALTGLAACSSESGEYKKKANPNVLTETSFEEVSGWGVDPATLTKERAHSGAYSIRVDKDHEFSLTYDVVLGQVSPRKVKKVRLHTWVFLPSPNTHATLGVEIKDPENNNQTIAGDGIHMETVTEYNKWVEVEKVIDMPESLAPTHHLRMFLWRGGAVDPVYVDDLTLTIED